jgi:tRNA U38,U39,U40 pseudouridine synthase TruA
MRIRQPLSVCTAASGAMTGAEEVQIRVFQVTKVPKSFRARYACAARSYEYLLPTRCLGLPTGDLAEDGALPLPASQCCIRLLHTVGQAGDGVCAVSPRASRMCCACVHPQADWVAGGCRQSGDWRCFEAH